MYRGFPFDLLALLRCPGDSGTLTLERAARTDDNVQSGILRCARCETAYEIRDGVAIFLDPATLDAESRNEQQRRDEGARGQDNSWEATAWHEMEIQPTMEASEPLPNARVLELGAGTGRHTVHMLRRGATLVAVDFSGVSLANLAARVEPGWKIGLVQADCTRFAVAPGAFDLVASTLVSNLPTESHRSAMMNVAATALKPEGKFVFGTHHFGLRSLMNREPRSGYYREAPIYRYMFRRPEIDAETLVHFGTVDTHPIRIALPFLGRLPVPMVKVSRLSERLPIINEFGELLLSVAKTPRPSPHHRP